MKIDSHKIQILLCRLYYNVLVHVSASDLEPDSETKRKAELLQVLVQLTELLQVLVQLTELLHVLVQLTELTED